MQDDDTLIYSPLQRIHTDDGKSIDIHIYHRLTFSGWTLEVVDEFGNSTVWDDEFATDQEALDEVLKTIREEGIDSLIGEKSMAPTGASIHPAPLFTSLTMDELDELEAFLSSDATPDEAMSIDQLDGYLTAIVIGPCHLRMNDWMSGIWGPTENDAPHFETMEDAQRIMNLILRHYNDIISSLEDDPDAFDPLFYTIEPLDEEREYTDGEMWAYGFMNGVKLCPDDWQPLFDDPRGNVWLRPLILLGADEVTPEEEELTTGFANREELTLQIPAAIANIYRYWLPYRKAVHERLMATTYQREHPKIGRNDPCPCGSGKKFKKCCGAGADLH